jgi:hypothetical protein
MLFITTSVNNNYNSKIKEHYYNMRKEEIVAS